MYHTHTQNSMLNAKAPGLCSLFHLSRRPHSPCLLLFLHTVQCTFYTVHNCTIPIPIYIILLYIHMEIVLVIWSLSNDMCIISAGWMWICMWICICTVAGNEMKNREQGCSPFLHINLNLKFFTRILSFFHVLYVSTYYTVVCMYSVQCTACLHLRGKDMRMRMMRKFFFFTNSVWRLSPRTQALNEWMRLSNWAKIFFFSPTFICLFVSFINICICMSWMI